MQERARAADEFAKSAAFTVKRKEGAANSLCGAGESGLARSFCGVNGIFGVTLSQISIAGNPTQFGGSSTNRIASIAVPAVAARYVPSPDRLPVALDLGGYSAFLTKSITATTPTTTKVSCSKNGGGFESKLPCEANADIYPYVGAYVGATIGRSGVGYITLVPFTAGLAQVGSAASLRPYFGWMLGLLQINGTFP